MADLSSNLAGLKSPNPFWLASAPPTNSGRPLEVNFKEMAEVKKRFSKHAVISSLMVESREEWKEIIKGSVNAGCDGLELNFGCPHGMYERDTGSAIGQEPRVLEEITSWAVEYSSVPVIVKLTPNVSEIVLPGLAAVRGKAHAVSLINTISAPWFAPSLAVFP